eukprot:CAMPEP_0185035482 /NCGR_PEP_ID=MMETSP1103-20130426/26931_1 /TAXON_ID=36769 /ORGANISM="Paraphysomonas bandaiensis, Strain Caron Lab Isolate" /LENGTH=1068 /DNA_ID=CAMNT_0027572581 /DNA_START=27 /DNA_END=3233 /DNA_ORIENTATION=+
MSLAEAFKAVKSATAVIEKLKEEQTKAATEVFYAKQQVKSSTINKQSNDQYGNTQYWDQRYEKENEEKIYEWYLNFEDIQEILVYDLQECMERLGNNLPSNEMIGEILVSGCGNSSLCEDLWKAGFRHICGSDYSAAVINNMEQRRTRNDMKTLRYIQADGRHMPASMSRSCMAVIDKGTLDAIASATDPGDSMSGPKSAALYLESTWGVLQEFGVFIIITTMPQSVFEVIAECLFKYAYVPKGQSKPYKCRPITTSEGGSVYYFTLIKGKLGAANATKDEIARLIEEAQSAVQQLEEAKSKVETQRKHQSSIKTDLDAAEKRAQELSSELDRGWQQMSHLRPEDFDEKTYSTAGKSVNYDGDSNIRAPKGTATELYQPPSLRTPIVTLQVIEEGSTIEPNGCINVEYTLTDGDWDEDDFIVLDTRHNEAASGGAEASNNIASDSIDGEFFEYTNEPKEERNKGEKCIYRGRVKIKLPPYGGVFRLFYKRTCISYANGSQITSAISEIDDTGEPTQSNNIVVSRSYDLLAQSSSISIPFLLQNSSREKSIFCRGNHGRGGICQVEETQNGVNCVIPKQHDNLSYFVEDMRNINVLVVTIQEKDKRAQSGMNNICSWFSKHHNGSVVVVTVESDVYISNRQNKSESVSVLSYSCIPITVSSGLSLHLDSAYGVITDGCIVLRIPYTKTDGETVANSKSSDEACRAHTDSGAIACSFCCNTIVDPGVIQTVKALPSGLFDHMMHEFVCSESQPAMPMSVADLITPRGSVYVGNVFMTASPQDIAAIATTSTDSLNCPIKCICKTQNSVLDVITGSGFIVENVARAVDSHKIGVLSEENSIHPNFVDSSTCLILCARCRSTLGDGQLRADNTMGSTNDASDSHDGTGTFSLSDLQDVRFLKYAVNYIGCKNSSEQGHSLWDLLPTCTAAEQVIANALVSIVERFDTSAFELVVPDWQGSNRETLCIRMITRRSTHTDASVSSSFRSGYGVYLPQHDSAILVSESTAPVGNIRDAIKVSFCVVSQKSTLPSSRKRVPVEYWVFREIVTALEARSIFSGKSFFAGEKMSFLYL